MNTQKMNLYINILKYVLATVGVIGSALLFFGPNVTEGTEAVEKFREGSTMNFAIYFTFFILLAAVGIVLLFFVSSLITNTKRTVMSIIGILISVIVYLVISLMGTTDTTDTLLLKNPVSQSVVDSTTTGIYTIFVAIGAALLAVILGPLMGRLRK